MTQDVIGKSLLSYYKTKVPQKIYWETEISEMDEMAMAYFFRDFSEMPKIEQVALEQCYGKILDVGCGAGAHLQYLLQKNADVVGLDVSEYAIQTCQLRGFEATFVKSLLEETASYDTILLLMNGTGIFETLEKSVLYLAHLKTILNPGGQILIDSSDILYMYDREADGSIWIPNSYYGELTFRVSNDAKEIQEFAWLYLDFDTLQQLCATVGLVAQKIVTGEHHDYLARLTPQNIKKTVNLTTNCF